MIGNDRGLKPSISNNVPVDHDPWLPQTNHQLGQEEGNIQLHASKRKVLTDQKMPRSTSECTIVTSIYPELSFLQLL